MNGVATPSMKGIVQGILSSADTGFLKQYRDLGDLYPSGLSRSKCPKSLPTSVLPFKTPSRSQSHDYTILSKILLMHPVQQRFCSPFREVEDGRFPVRPDVGNNYAK